jgi:hypothetical protein
LTKQTIQSPNPPKGEKPPPNQKIGLTPDQAPENIKALLRRNVTLISPYPVSYTGAPTDKLSLQYAVIELSKQVGLSYNFDQSFSNTDPSCRAWITPDIKEKPLDEALRVILLPLHLTYRIQDNSIVLVKEDGQ